MNFVELKEEHLEFLLAVRNQESTRQFLENDSIFNLSECKEWFSNLKSTWYIISVNNLPVGYFRTNGDEIGCDIHPDFRRNGFARMSYEYYLKNVKLASLWVFEDNFAKNLYESLGFLPSGKTKNIRNRNYIHMVWNRA
jgi:hypothetical protein